MHCIACVAFATSIDNAPTPPKPFVCYGAARGRRALIKTPAKPKPRRVSHKRKNLELSQRQPIPRARGAINPSSNGSSARALGPGTGERPHEAAIKPRKWVRIIPKLRNANEPRR